MMKIDVVFDGEKAQLNIHGRIDSNSAQELQDEILKVSQKSSTIIVNFADTAYISSAGLRALLIGHKTATSKGGKFIIINANEVVKDVLRVTGLQGVFDIR